MPPPFLGMDPYSCPNPDATLDLGKVVSAVYARGGYDAQLEHREGVPLPPLTVDEAQWVTKRLEPYR